MVQQDLVGRKETRDTLVLLDYWDCPEDEDNQGYQEKRENVVLLV